MRNILICLFITIYVLTLFASSRIIDSNNDRIIFANGYSFYTNSQGNIYFAYGKRINQENFLLYFSYSENGQSQVLTTMVDTLYNYAFIKEKTAPILFVTNGRITIYYTKSPNPSTFELWKAVSDDDGQTFSKTFMDDNVFLPVNMVFNNENQILFYIKGKKKPITQYQYYTKYETTENQTSLPFNYYTDTYYGMVHSNDIINILSVEGLYPIFNSLVTTSQHFTVSDGAQLSDIFPNGYLEGVPPENYTLPEDFDPYMPFASYDADIVYVNIQGTHYTSKLGKIQVIGVENFPVYAWYPQDAQQAQEAYDNGYNWLDPQNIIYINQVTLYDTIWTDGPTEDIENDSQLFTEKTLWIKGNISQKQFWCSSENVYLVGDITYQNTPVGTPPDHPENYNEQDYFGLVSLKRIIIKYKFKDPMNDFQINDDNCDGINLYGAYCAVQEADENIYGDMTSHFDGIFTFEYQHPHGSTPDFVGISPFTGNDTLYTFVDLHKFIYPPDFSLSEDLFPYNIHGGNPVPPYNICGYPYESEDYQPGSYNPPYGTDYPWYNPVWPEPASSIVTERGTIHLFGGVYQVRKGFIHRSGSDNFNHPSDNFWHLDNQTFYYGSTHPSTGYDKDYYFDKRLLLNPFEEFPQSFLNIQSQKLYIKLSADNGDTFEEITNEEVPISLLKKTAFLYGNNYIYVIQSGSSEIYFVTVQPDGAITNIEGIDLSNISNSIVAKKMKIHNDRIYILANSPTTDYLLYHQMGNEDYTLFFSTPKPLASDFCLVDNDDYFACYFKLENQEIIPYCFPDENVEDYVEYNAIDLNTIVNYYSRMQSFVDDENLAYFAISANAPAGETSNLIFAYGELTPLSNDENLIQETPITFKSYPNPFRVYTKNGKATFTISLNIPKTQKVNVSIYNMKGQKIKTLITKNLNAGKQNIVWNGTDRNNKEVKSGLYFYKIKTENERIIKKFILLR